MPRRRPVTGAGRTAAGGRLNDLRIAVPRGALFADTLDLLDRLGIDTREVRDNDRKLLFERQRDRHDAAVRRARRTSRPARPTSGSPARTCCWSSPSARSTSCSTSATVAVRWCSPATRARTGRPRRCAGSASCGSRRSTRGSPRATSCTTGRQAEIVEVKGSVELAPLTGLVEGDRRPHRDRHDAARERARGPRGDRASARRA